MDAFELIETRLSALEAIYRSQPSVPDVRPELKQLRDELLQVKADSQTALARRIPSTTSLVTRAELHESLRSMSKAMAEHVVDGEKQIKQQVTNKFDSTVNALHSDVQASRNAAYSSGLFAANMLLSKSSTFGR